MELNRTTLRRTAPLRERMLVKLPTVAAKKLEGTLEKTTPG